ncbi:MAG TPA: hypothetical protein VI483_00565, partial [Candidatus Paceibacterota bacterium]
VQNAILLKSLLSSDSIQTSKRTFAQARVEMHWRAEKRGNDVRSLRRAFQVRTYNPMNAKRHKLFGKRASLCFAVFINFSIGVPLEPVLDIPIGLGMADEDEFHIPYITEEPAKKKSPEAHLCASGR